MYLFANCTATELSEAGKHYINNKEEAATVERQDGGNSTGEKVAAST